MNLPDNVVSAKLTQLIANLEQGSRRDGVEALVVGAVIVRNDRALVLVRSEDNVFMAGCGDIPGGYVVVGESLVSALKRETLEETGLVLKRIGKYLGTFDFVTGQGRRARQFNFLVEVSGDRIELMPGEHSAYRWCDPLDEEELRRLRVSTEVRKVLRAAAE